MLTYSETECYTDCFHLMSQGINQEGQQNLYNQKNTNTACGNCFRLSTDRLEAESLYIYTYITGGQNQCLIIPVGVRTSHPASFETEKRKRHCPNNIRLLFEEYFSISHPGRISESIVEICQCVG